MDDSSLSAEEPLALSILSSIVEDPLALSIDGGEFEGGATELADERLEPLMTSTPAKRKRKAIQNESLDSSIAEEPLWPENSVSIPLQEEQTSRGGRSLEDDGAELPVISEDESSSSNNPKSGSEFEGKISTSNLSKFKERAFFFMFEDEGSRCRNRVVELGGKVVELFDVLKVTDLVVHRKIDGSAPLAKFDT